MTVEELCQRFDLKWETFRTWRKRGIIPAPYGGPTSKSRYGRVHVEAIQAHLDLKHHNVSAKAAVAFCREVGWTLPEYVAYREQADRDFTLGIA